MGVILGACTVSVDERPAGRRLNGLGLRSSSRAREAVLTPTCAPPQPAYRYSSFTTGLSVSLVKARSSSIAPNASVVESGETAFLRRPPEGLLEAHEASQRQ